MVMDQDPKNQPTSAEQEFLKSTPKRTLDEIWPVHSTGVWPQGLSLRREDIYTDRIELVQD